MKKNKDLSVMLKEAGILFLITLIAGLLLGVVNELTKEPIREKQEQAIQEACQAVLPSAAFFEEIDYTLDLALQQELSGMGVKTGSIFKAAAADGALLGYVVEAVSTQGYGGNIGLYLGVTIDGTLNDISILEISETPGLGMQAEDVLAPQFHDKKASSFLYTKNGAAADNEIDAITSATITTKAVVNAVNGGLKVAHTLIEGGGLHE